KNRNWFRGAEMLELNLGGGYETQIGGEQLSTNSYTLNGDINVYFPSFVSPFKLINPRIPFVPRTRISAGYELLNRANLYTLRAIKGSYGYNWRQNTRIEHTFNPFAMSYTQPDNITDEFQQILDQDLALRQSFEKQFIIGGNYTFQFNNQTEVKLWNTSFVEFEADVSGNLIGLVTKRGATGNQKQLFGTPFAQYARLTADARNYWKLNNKGLTWVNRIYTGVGLAYGNSEYMPFVKQYYIGVCYNLIFFITITLGYGSN